MNFAIHINEWKIWNETMIWFDDVRQPLKVFERIYDRIPFEWRSIWFN